MNISLIFVTLAVLNYVNTSVSEEHIVSDSESELDREWEEFKSIYNKDYHGYEEYKRRLIWESNLEFIKNHNLEYAFGKYSYSLGVNQFADLTHREFVGIYLGGQRQQSVLNETVDMAMYRGRQLPDHVDWREEGYVTPVKDQGSCGSCYAHGAVGAIEGQYFHRTGELVSLSEQQIVDCSGQYGNNGCNGGFSSAVFEYVKNRGIARAENYPYTAEEGQCNILDKNILTKISEYRTVPSRNEEKLREAVARVGPVSISIDARRPTFQFYRSGVFDDEECLDKNLNHEVLLVGYGREDSKDYWIVKNSWGESWGHDGYVLMSRNKKNQCGIATLAVYPLI